MKAQTARDVWNERYAAREYVWTATANQFVSAHLADLEPGDAIDLGAGEGRNAVWLARQGWRVTAVDISPVGLDKANRLAADNGVSIGTVEADAAQFSPDEPTDLVVLSYLQVRPEDRQAILANAPTWVRPGGTLFLVAHDKTNIGGGYGGPQDPDVCYDLDEVVAALDGFDISVAAVAERVVSTDDGERVALDTLVVATRPG